MKQTTLLAILILLFVACDSGSKGDSASPAPSATAAAKLPESDTEVDKADVPVEEDFEGEAQKAINGDNLDDEVAKIAKEIDNDKE